MSSIPKLSVVVVAYNMRREIPRSLQSLSPDYQQRLDADDYEVLVIDNGSSSPVGPRLVQSFGPNFGYLFLENAPPSPARAINVGVDRARGEVVCIMIDGAHLLTPGVLRLARSAFLAFHNPLVMTRYFFLGPGIQNETVQWGYNQEHEDRLLESIQWPVDGYRLFEIGCPLHGGEPKVTWLNRMSESNALFVRKKTFEDIGGADERFDSPGGGFLNLDIWSEVAKLDDTELVHLIGEGSFHQVHGGITTNTSVEDRKQRVAGYHSQYRAIRGVDFSVSDKPINFIGHLPTQHSKIHLFHKKQGGKPSRALKKRLQGARAT